MTHEQEVLRQLLEAYVVSTNTTLKDTVKSMNNLVLLRNSHPIYRPDFAREFERHGMITREEAIEFVKILKAA